jgi:transposase InsO family protein
MNDNAHMESFFHTLKNELHEQLSVRTDAALRRVIATYLDYYNHRRGHTSFEHHSSVDKQTHRCQQERVRIRCGTIMRYAAAAA